MKSEDKNKLEQYFREDPYWIERARKRYLAKVFEGSTASQNIFTKEFLCSEIVGKLRKNCELSNKSILTLNVEFVTVLGNEDITFFSDCPKKSRYIRGFYPNVKIIEGDFLKWETDMKFDIIIGNPPYQAVGGEKNSIWDKFIAKSFGLAKEEGYIALINPSGWRGTGSFSKTIGQEMIRRQILYLEMHDNKDGQNTFGVSTCYDWYIIRNSFNNIKTTIIDRDGIQSSIDVKEIPFIPNSMIDKVLSLVAKDGEERCEIIYARSSYGADKQWMSKIQDKVYIYPCVYSINTKNEANFFYSKNNDRGHFGVPKIILGDGCNFGIVKDVKGEYGMTQWAFGIADKIENFDLIEKALCSKEFQKINKATTTKNTAGIGVVDRNIIKYFRKDFWKEFI